MSLLALGARQCVFILAAGVQEYREILTHLLVALAEQVFGPGADNHPVALNDRVTEQGIAHRAANQIDLHGASLQVEWGGVMAQRMQA